MRSTVISGSPNVPNDRVIADDYLDQVGLFGSMAIDSAASIPPAAVLRTSDALTEKVGTWVEAAGPILLDVAHSYVKTGSNVALGMAAGVAGDGLTELAGSQVEREAPIGVNPGALNSVGQRLGAWSTFEVPRWFPHVARRLGELGAADRKSKEYPTRDADLIRRAWQVLWVTLDSDFLPPAVMPNVDGGIDFIWREQGWHLELTVDPDEVAIWARDRSDDRIWYDNYEALRDWFRERIAAISR